MAENADLSEHIFDELLRDTWENSRNAKTWIINGKIRHDLNVDGERMNGFKLKKVFQFFKN
jgi:hypothetical protein